MFRLLFLLFFCLLLSNGIVRAQSKINTDSLWTVFNNKTNHDTLRMDALRSIAFSLVYPNPDSADVLYDQLFAMATADSNFKFIGYVYADRSRIAKNHTQYSLAIQNAYTAINYFTRIKYERGIVSCQLQLANLYSLTKDFEKSEENYLAAIAYYEQIGDRKNLGSTYSSIGNMLRTKGKNDSLALIYLRKSLALNNELKYEYGVASASNNMAGVFYNMHEFDSALKYMQIFLEVAYARKSQDDVATALGNIGGIYNLMGRHEQALDSCRKGYGIAIETGELRDQNLNCDCLTDAFDGLKQIDSAYHYFKLLVAISDSMQSMAREDEIVRQEVTFKYEQEAIKDSLQQVETERVEIERRAGEKNLRISLFAGLGLTLVFAGLMFNRFRVTRKQRNQIAAQALATEEQKRVIEVKNKEITDSINYAQRIQQAIFPPEQELKKAYTDIFVLFIPRDIVSGDFYWYDESANNQVIAVADCTGHGVPGGFMSMLGYEILQDVVMLEEITTTAEALSRLDRKVTTALNKNDKTYRDGMDMVLCSFPKNKMELHYSGANRPLLHFTDGVMNVYKPDKHTIGGAIDDLKKDFTMHVIPLKKGDMIYLFTDGYADQFGGADGKKFMSKKLEQLLASITDLDCATQKKRMETVFNEWKGSLEQVDDVCVIGIRI